MKNLTKIFMAVAVAMFAFACVTDTTEDLGIEVGKGGVTEITVSLEESRTQLGEKADGKYPLYWSEGDQIAINGVASAALTEGGNAAATFSFGEVLTTPYNIVYPASEGANVVNFLAVQPYTVGTFAPKAAPMYGYSEGVPTEGVQLNHLTGVLRFAVKGSDKLASLTLTAEGKIAGNFDIDCTSGALTAHEDALNSVTVTFGGGLQLTDEATPIYVAVPAGSHGLYTITLTSTDGKAMVVKYDSDAKPVKVGVVKEFGEILYAPSEVADPEGELVIVSESDMLRLQKWAADGKLANVTKVTVGATIDMSGVADWQPIAGFPAIEFDGGSDKGYEIKGLTSALFDTVTGATIKNVKLTEVNVVENDKFHFGILACEAVDTSISNCFVGGDFEYENDNAITGATNDSFAVGAMVGVLRGASTLSDSTTDVVVDIKKFAASASAKIYNGFGGIVGRTKGSSTTFVQITNCTSLSQLTNSSTNVSNVQPAIGGIAGLAYTTSFNTIVNGAEGDNNSGDITLTKHIGCTCTGSIVGAGKDCNFDTITNYGIILQKSTVNYSYIGGIFGSWWTNDNDVAYTLKNITNNGGIIVEEGISHTSSGTPYYGGIIGRHQGTKGSVTLENCTNNGVVEILADFKLSGSAHCYIGGIIGGGAEMYFKDCNNNGAITQHGDVNTNKPAWKPKSGTTKGAFTNTTTLYLGGIIGKVDSSTIQDCDNNGPISIDTDCIYGYIGGIVGAAACTTFKSNTNGVNGDITVAGSFNLNVGICGMGASLGCATTDCSNAGDITVSATEPQGDTYTKDDGSTAKATGAIYVNGLAWTANYNHTNFTNSGNITFTGDSYTNVFVSGAAYTPSKTIKNVHNTGNIVADVNNLHCPLKLGGICRSSSTGTYDSCSNSGDIVFKGTATSSVYIGGLCGDVTGGTYTGTGFVNSGAIKFLGHANTGYAGGIAGAATVAITSATAMKNEGTVTNYDATAALTGSAATVRWGGCFGSVSSKPQSVAMVNTGDVYVRYSEKMGADVTIGGVAGGCSQVISNATVCSDVAAIGFTESAADPIVGVGMVVGSYRSTTAPQVSNCVIGGRLALEERDGNPLYRTISKELIGIEDVDNNTVDPDPNFIPYWEKIYGGNVEWGTGSTYDGCTPHSTAPSSAEM